MAWLPSLIVEPEVARTEARIAAQMFNALADVVYFGMSQVDARGVAAGRVAEPCLPESLGRAAAKYYLEKWFWTPTLRLLRPASRGASGGYQIHECPLHPEHRGSLVAGVHLHLGSRRR